MYDVGDIVAITKKSGYYRIIERKRRFYSKSTPGLVIYDPDDIDIDDELPSYYVVEQSNRDSGLFYYGKNYSFTVHEQDLYSAIDKINNDIKDMEIKLEYMKKFQKDIS